MKNSHFTRKVCPFCGKNVKIYNVDVVVKDNYSNDLKEYMKNVSCFGIIDHENTDDVCFLNDLIFNHKPYTIYRKDKNNENIAISKIWNTRPFQL